MHHCPRCQSPNLVSNKIEEDYLERATAFAQATQPIGIKRLSVLAGLGAVLMKCLDCEYRFDL